MSVAYFSKILIFLMENFSGNNFTGIFFGLANFRD